VKFRRILEVLRIKGLQKDFWGHYHDLCVQKWSCLLWSSDRFWKFSPCKLYKKDMGAFSRLMRPKTELFAVNFRRILELLRLQGSWKKLWVKFHDLCVQKWICLLWSWDAFWKFSLCKLHKTFLGTFSRFLHPQTKLFAIKLRCILEVLRLEGLRRKFCRNFHDLCAHKRRCLLWSSHTFWKFSACKVYRKSSGHIITIYVSKNEVVSCGSSPPAKFTQKSSGHIFTICVSNKQTLLTSTFCKKLWPRFTILRAHKSLLCCSDSLWRSHFIRTHCFEPECIWTMTAPTTYIWTSKEWTDFVKFDPR